MTRHYVMVLAVGGLIAAAGIDALTPSSAEARGFVGPAPSSSHPYYGSSASSRSSPVDFGHAEHGKMPRKPLARPAKVWHG